MPTYHDALSAHPSEFLTFASEMTAAASDLATQQTDYGTKVSEKKLEHGDEIVFLKRVSPGPSDRSYGIHVGRLAGLPDRVVQRAGEILRNLEAGERRSGRVTSLAAGELAPAGDQRVAEQITLFAAGSLYPVVEKLDGLNLDHLSPKEALELLYEIQDDLKS